METKTKNEVKVWNVDASHSSIHFAAKHMVIAKTKGSFDVYKLNVETNGLDFENAKIELEIEAKSINTNMPDRDNHLKSPDFFNVEQFPTIKFVSKSFKKVNEEDYILNGDITIRDVTKNINFSVNYGGQVIDPWGNIRSGFTLESSIDRFDFGLTWNALIETGGAMVGKIIKLEAEIELTTSK